MPSVNRSGLVIVAPHKKTSRQVIIDDIEKIKELYFPMQMFMEDLEASKAFSDVFAVAHQQVEESYPLRFFVINGNNKVVKHELDGWQKDGLSDLLVINPVIVRHTRHTVTKSEGCLSFPGLPNSDVERWNKIEVEYQVISFDGKTLEDRRAICSGKLSQIFQHEIDHFDCRYINDPIFSAVSRENEVGK